MSNGEDSITVHIESMLSKMPNPKFFNPKIYKVDQTLRQGNERAYDPGLVAIGPIHHNRDHLKDMEQIKLSYLHQFLQRNSDHTVNIYVKRLKELEERARNCYSDFIQLPDTDKFVEMLLLDGSFVVVLLRKLHFQDWRVENEYIFNSDQVLKRVVADLLLVENQLPFFILRELFDMTKSNHPEDNLSSFVLRGLSWVLPWKHRVYSFPLLQDQNHVDDHLLGMDQNDVNDHLLEMGQNHGEDHLLGMMHRAYFSSEAANVRNKEINGTKFKTINTASELDEVGISFKMVDEGVMNVSFTSDQAIQVSQLAIEDYTEIVLRNFIAYEQMHPKIEQKYVSDYSALMTDLLKSSKDVEILIRARILVNMLGDDDSVHFMFNQLGKHVNVDNFCYSDVSESVMKHCIRRRNKWLALLRRRCRKWMVILGTNYFNSPWSIMSVIAAIVLLILTTVQTYYSVLSYEK